MNDLDRLREEYRLCKAAYDRGDPFATEALARNCPALVAALEQRVKELEGQEAGLAEADITRLTRRAEQAEAALLDSRIEAGQVMEKLGQAEAEVEWRDKELDRLGIEQVMHEYVTPVVQARIRELEAENERLRWMLNEMVYLHNTTESRWTTADLESRWTRREP